ncbi:unnamed protein product, partial [Oikopleura dioica]
WTSSAWPNAYVNRVGTEMTETCKLLSSPGNGGEPFKQQRILVVQNSPLQELTESLKN